MNILKLENFLVKKEQIPSIHNQRGVVLFIALIVLVAMSLAGISMMRAVDTGTLVAGNLASRQNAINAPDAAFEIALAQIVAMVANGTSSGATTVTGYSAVNVQSSVDKRAWDSAQDLGTSPISGNRLQLLIDRICTPSADCERTPGDDANPPGGNLGGAGPGFKPFYQHFRSIVRVTDPKGMVHYVEFKNE